MPVIDTTIKERITQISNLPNPKARIKAFRNLILDVLADYLDKQHDTQKTELMKEWSELNEDEYEL